MLGAAAEEAPPEAVEAPQAAEGVTEEADFNFLVAAAPKGAMGAPI